jgi:hypothetical protein
MVGIGVSVGVGEGVGVRVEVGVAVAVGVEVGGSGVGVSVGGSAKKDNPLSASSWQADKIMARSNKIKLKYRHIGGYYAIGLTKRKTATNSPEILALSES